MTLDDLRIWNRASLKPFVELASKIVPLGSLTGLLIGHGVRVGRAGGLTTDDLRRVLEIALDEIV